MAKKPLYLPAPVTGRVPAAALRQRPAPSTAQGTVDGTQYCVQDNLAQVVLWVNKKLMRRFGYATPTSWQIGQRSARRSQRSTRATSSGPAGSRSATGSTS